MKSGADLPLPSFFEFDSDSREFKVLDDEVT